MLLTKAKIFFSDISLTSEILNPHFHGFKYFLDFSNFFLIRQKKNPGFPDLADFPWILGTPEIKCLETVTTHSEITHLMTMMLLLWFAYLEAAVRNVLQNKCSINLAIFTGKHLC